MVSIRTKPGLCGEYDCCDMGGYGGMGMGMGGMYGGMGMGGMYGGMNQENAPFFQRA